ncbi:MAG TPA: hypothetical protein DCL63_02580 [Firmicutes bacterium]|jgi:predicted RNA binding protein YcfA (HicA-like mRNA interferase family)|nr:hypothetical protein [Bacillota bacterium]
MGRLEKLLRDMRNSPTTVRYDEIENLLMGAGCRVTKRGSHRTFRHPAVSDFGLTVVEAHPMKAPYVRQALRLYNEIMEAIRNDSNR